MLTVVGYDDDGEIIYTGMLSSSMSLEEVIKHITFTSKVICNSFEVAS